MRKDLSIPIQRFQIHQERAGCIGNIGDMHTGHIPEQPGVHVTEDQFALFGALACSGNIVQDPLDLRPGEISRQRQTGLGSETVLPAIFGQFITNCICARVLPDDGIIDRASGCAFPDQAGLTLVGDPYGGDIGYICARVVQGAPYYMLGTFPDLQARYVPPSPAWGRAAGAPSGPRRRYSRCDQTGCSEYWLCPGRWMQHTLPLKLSYHE